MLTTSIMGLARCPLQQIDALNRATMKQRFCDETGQVHCFCAPRQIAEVNPATKQRRHLCGVTDQDCRLLLKMTPSQLLTLVHVWVYLPIFYIYSLIFTIIL